jgi:hypothetical protein
VNVDLDELVVIVPHPGGRVIPTDFDVSVPPRAAILVASLDEAG